MRKLIFTLLAFCNCIVINAQDESHFTQFFSNKLIQNPAYAGSAEVLSGTILHRQQWVGLAGAPSTQAISFHAPFFNKRVGAGLSILRDEITIAENWSIISSYAYRIPTVRGTWSVGLQADLRFAKIKWNEVDALDIEDGEIPTWNTQEFHPNMSAGVYYNASKFYAGLSVKNIWNSNWNQRRKNNFNNFGKSKTHLYLMGGYVFSLSDHINFAPVALVQLVRNAPFDMDVNASFIFFEKFWTGASWRKDDSVDVIFQYQLNQQLRVGVAYDFTISELQDANKGSYELLFQYDFNFKETGFSNLRHF